MVYLYLIGIPLALLVLFMGFIALEARAGRRFLAGPRYTLDLKVSRAAFIANHVDWGAFTSDVVRASLERALHDIAHSTLIAVRALERQLTVIVRTLRARREHPAIAAPRDARPSRLESAMTYIRQSVRRSRKQLSASEERDAGSDTN